MKVSSKMVISATDIATRGSKNLNKPCWGNVGVSSRPLYGHDG